MKTLDHKSIVIGVLCAVAIVAAWRVAAAPGAGGDSSSGWEYAQLRIQGDKIVFSQATRESVVTPATARLPSRRSGGEPNSSRYVLKTTAKRNHTVAAMDLFGKDGWEAVSVASVGAETVILMKRHAK